MVVRITSAFALLGLLFSVVVAARVPDESAKPLAEQGYLGLSLRDIPGGHTVVSWIFPGPMHGEGINPGSLDIGRPDLIVAVDGRTMNAGEFTDYIRDRRPGESVEIEYRRSNARGGTIPDAVNHEDEVHTLEVVLGSRDEWMGTIGRARGHETTITFSEPMTLDPFDAGNVLGRGVTEHDLAAPLRTLIGVFAEWQEENDDFHSLSRVRAAFENPFCLPELQQIITAETRAAPSEPIATARTLMKSNLDAPDPKAFSAAAWIDPGCTPVEAAMFDGLHAANLHMRHALGDLYGDAVFAEMCLELLRVPRRTFYLTGDDTKKHVSVIRGSMGVDFGGYESVLIAFEHLSASIPETFDEFVPKPPPPELAGAVEGEILSACFSESVGWVVIGSAASNRYDMAHIAAVVDVGGDDVYHATDLRLGSRAIIDLGGDDHYTGTPGQGAGGALLGASFIDDRAGDDVYEGELLACGAAMFGVSLLLDRAGNDTYTGGEWSIGSGCYGAGMLIDLGDGNDVYLGEFLCQGVGGPRGFGCIIDENGRDLYRANGPTPSAYGTPAVYQAFSQGIGFGFRNYAAGGIGMISDLGGDDRYEGGEFAQGGAYYWGLGILHDANGRDLYYGNRYGQGFGVHQAVGILVDEAGDDTYWSMTAASQGSAWDVGVGMLLDKAGDDSYQCDGLGQGGASQQGIAILIDMAGVDRYVAGGGATQGQSGADRYHFHETSAFSFSLLMDLGGQADHYSRRRANDAVTSTGLLNDSDPQASSLHGLCIDE